MKQTINLYQFRDAFQSIRPDNFSYEGLEVLFDYLEECDSELELDVIAICCDFSQCSLKEFISGFNIALEEGQSQLDAIEEFINKNGFWYCLVENNQEIIFENF